MTCKVVQYLLLVSFLLASGLVQASNLMAESSTGVPASFKLGLYLQPRVEYGDLYFGDPQVLQSGQADIYFRRASVGVYSSSLSGKLKGGVILSGDETPQDKTIPVYADEPASLTGYIEYEYVQSQKIRFEKGKLPLSRIYVVSSSQQLFAERPYYVSSWDQVLRSYSSTSFSLLGTVADQFDYWFSTGKGWRYGDVLHEERNIEAAEAPPITMLRLDWSPFNLREASRSDAHLGEGVHFTIGAYASLQDGIRYREDQEITESSEKRTLYGLDVSMHWRRLSFLFEQNAWRIDASRSDLSRHASGVILQSGYYIEHFGVEPAIRFESFREEGHSSSNLKRYTAGINKYINGNKLKFVLNYEYTRYQSGYGSLSRGDGDTKAIRLTSQIIL